jgi:hypothetical protein
MAFKKGNKFGRHGKQPGAGRKPDWFKQKCLEIGTSQKALAFLKAVIEGEPVEEKRMFEDDKPITVWESASADARVRAWNSVMDRAIGKPVQALEHSGSIATNWVINVVGPHAG